MGKCKIVSLKKARRRTDSTAIIRISADNHDSILKIVDETARGVREVTDILLEYALNRVEILEKPDE